MLLLNFNLDSRC